MRLFLAILPDEKMRTALINTQERLRKKGLKGRYTPEWNLHLTLAFIGEYQDPDAVMDAVQSVSMEPFSIRMDGYGRFDATVWAGIAENEELSAYVKKLRRAMSSSGIPFDSKPFAPHITVVRGVEKNIMLPGIMIPGASMKVQEVSLMRSDRGKNGMNYTEIDRYPLL